jgi:hypothetical protein
MLYFTRRPLKNPALVVFCLILAVSPCSAVLTSPFFFDVSLLTSVLSPVPLWLRLACFLSKTIHSVGICLTYSRRWSEYPPGSLFLPILE